MYRKIEFLMMLEKHGQKRLGFDSPAFLSKSFPVKNRVRAFRSNQV